MGVRDGWNRFRTRIGALRGRRLLLAVVGAVALVLLAWLIVTYLTRPPPAPVDVVRREDLVRILALTGEVEPVERVDVVPEVTGELVALPVPEGARVTGGQLLARIEAGEVEEQVAQARAALGARQDELAQARRELERARRLAAAGALPEQELEQARLAVEQGVEQVQELRARVAEIQERQGRYTLRAPMAGVVLERPVDRGQVVGPETEIYEIASLDRWVEAEADERYFNALEAGMPAVISPVGSDRIYPAVITFIDREVDPETGAVMVRLRFAETPPWLIFGLSVDVNVRVEAHEDALTVRRAAVADVEEIQAWVLRVGADGVTERVPVDVIDWPSERLVVRRGLEAGDTVVLYPEQVPEGVEVRPVDEEPDAL